MSDGSLLDALNGRKGELDAWLEVHNEAECRDEILSLFDQEKKKPTTLQWYAGLAMQTFLKGAVLPTKEDREEWLPRLAEISFEMARFMIAESEKP